MFSRETIRNVIEGNEVHGTDRCALPVLSAASCAYGLAIRARAAAYRAGVLHTTRLPVPVVSVGNLTVGGSGKTPLVIELARVFSGLGCSVAVLSRGYGGEEPDEPLVVSDGEQILCDDPARAGDEPVLIARRAPGAAVVVCRIRARAGRHAIDALGCDLLLLDDGFQHLALHRDFDIVVFRSERGFGNEKLLPRGPLREPFSALSRAQLLVEISPSDQDPAQVPAGATSPSVPFPDLPHLRAVVRPAGLRTLWAPAGAGAPPTAAGRRVFCFSGIASPESFERSMREIGAVIAGSERFPDHHDYLPQDLERVWKRAAEAGADLIVTTEKDGVKVRRLLSMDTEIDLSAIPAAELVISLDFPVDALLEKVRTRLALPSPGGAASP